MAGSPGKMRIYCGLRVVPYPFVPAGVPGWLPGVGFEDEDWVVVVVLSADAVAFGAVVWVAGFPAGVVVAVGAAEAVAPSSQWKGSNWLSLLVQLGLREA